ncbi:MAG: MBL fold metallo-hydrolase [Candidatus Thorarchaeota archaeon]|nr:MAG: MBL fold metallo-hydrolase [Candidatus Thorarchaeota archaeon]
MTNPIDGVSRIEVPTPFPVGSMNCYLIEGSPLTLIDTGPKTAESLATIKQALLKLSYDMSDIEQILITHGHLDHIGLAAQFVRERERIHGSPTEVWIHNRDAIALINYEEHAELYMESFVRLIETSGVPKNDAQKLDPKRLIDYYLSIRESVPTARSFKDKDCFKTGIGEITAVWVPGHSSGSVCYVCDEQQVIFSGDHILGDISSNPSISFDSSKGISMLTYLESLNYISSREDYIALPGHRNPIFDIKSRIEALRTEYDDKFQKAADSLTSNPQTAYELSRTIYGDYDTNSLVLALAESHDILRILENRNQAKVINQNGVIHVVKH